MALHFYVFYTHKGFNIYERTCGTKEAAEKRVTELKKRYTNSEYFEGKIPVSYKWVY